MFSGEPPLHALPSPNVTWPCTQQYSVPSWTMQREPTPASAVVVGLALGLSDGLPVGGVGQHGCLVTPSIAIGQHCVESPAIEYGAAAHAA